VTLGVGDLAPSANLAEVRGGKILPVSPRALFMGRVAVVIGVPGAFTPLCTSRHLPDFIHSAPALKQSGIDSLYCIAPNDPFVVAAWAQALDPHGVIRFLSDGNLEFTRQLGVSAFYRDLFLGERCKRYLLVVHDGLIRKLRIEKEMMDYSCTRVEDVLFLDA
jgi:2-Cys peroxiredoxin 5